MGTRPPVNHVGYHRRSLGIILTWLGAVERLGHRKQICLTGGGLGRFALLLLAALPMFLGGQMLVYFAIVLSISRDAFNNLVYPAWMSITGDIVPLAGCGRYFASRNFIIGATGMATTLLIGEIIIVVMLLLSAGAAVGGFLVNTFGYPVIFWGSGIGRMAASLLFARFAASPAATRGG